MTTVWSFLFVLSLLILVHEAGHFFVARFFGIKVLKFSLGFGPRVWGIVRNGTDYCLSAFPLGGFVKMLGENPDEPVAAHEERESFSHRPVWQRALVVVAGPVSNLIFAWFVIFVILLTHGNPRLLPTIGHVNPESPAAKAGLMPEDTVISINDRHIDSWDEVAAGIRAFGGKAVKLEIKRGDEVIQLTVTPDLQKVKNLFGEEVMTPILGISASGALEIDRLNPIGAFAISAKRTWEMISLTVQGFVKLFQGVVPLSTLGGPVMIAQMAGEQAQHGLLNLFFFMAMLSVNLGVLNLLPIPVLDGGHLAFYAVEVVRRKAFTQQQMILAQRVGMAFLGALMLLVFYNDILRIIGLPNPFGPHPLERLP
jgi:regulator of sigma E protease